MSQLVFATNNLNKFKEIALLLPKGILLQSLADIGCKNELPETQSTIEGNALQKANYLSEMYKINCFADDTGLEIDALDGRPGVYSARYAGDSKNADDNMNRVLAEMKEVEDRRARFKTVIALIWNEQEYIFEGIVKGVIVESKVGSGGFGYDPIFKPEGMSKTFAQMSIEEKNEISHRARAVNKLLAFIQGSYQQ